MWAWLIWSCLGIGFVTHEGIEYREVPDGEVECFIKLPDEMRVAANEVNTVLGWRHPSQERVDYTQARQKVIDAGDRLFPVFELVLRVPGSRGVPKLLELLPDLTADITSLLPGVRSLAERGSPRAIKALGRIGKPEDIELMFRVLGHEHGAATYYALDALAEMGDAAAADRIEKVIEEWKAGKIDDEMVGRMLGYYEVALREIRFRLKRKAMDEELDPVKKEACRKDLLDMVMPCLKTEEGTPQWEWAIPKLAEIGAIEEKRALLRIAESTSDKWTLSDVFRSLGDFGDEESAVAIERLIDKRRIGMPPEEASSDDAIVEGERSVQEIRIRRLRAEMDAESQPARRSELEANLKALEADLDAFKWEHRPPREEADP